MKLARPLALVGALCLITIGLLGGSVGVLVSILDPTADLLIMVTVSISFLVLTVGLGAAVAWQAWQAMQERGSNPFQPKRVWILILAFVLALVVGQVVLVADLLPAVTFPLMHVAAAVLPAIIVVALVGRALAGVTRWRDVVFQTSIGALGSTCLAFTLELALVVGLLIAVFAAVAIRPGGPDLLQELAIRLQDPTWLQDASNLAHVIRSPVVLAGAFLVVAGMIPLIEELVKTVGVGLFAYRRPGLPEIYLWGLAGGAGFALAEGLFNSAGGLETWAPVALMRVGATLVHSVTGGLMGLAWYSVLAMGGWGRALGLYAACVGIHGLWNALTVVMTAFALTMVDGGGSEAESMLAQVGVAAVLALLIILTLAVGLGLVALTRHIARRTEAPESGETEPALPADDMTLDEGMMGEAS